MTYCLKTSTVYFPRGLVWAYGRLLKVNPSHSKGAKNLSVVYSAVSHM